MRKAAELVVQGEHGEVFPRSLRTGTRQHRVAYRARILLLRGQGWQPGRVAAAVGCGRTTVWRIEQR